MLRPSLAPIAERLPATVPFTGPEALERKLGREFLARLGANESPFGPAPSALAAMAEACSSVWKYADPESHDLRHALAGHHGIARDEIVIGEGIDGLLGLAVRLFAGPGESVVTSLGGYPTLNYHAVGFGARLVTVPYRDLHEDIDALAEAATREQAAIVYLANPDNPMGTWWHAEAIEQFIAAVPPTTLILLDEAYGEFAPLGTLAPLDTSRPNVLRLRTFSKAYGMAGLRCGYAMGERQTIAAFERVRNHFGVNTIAQAGALGALSDPDYLAQVVDLTVRAKARIAAIAEENGLRPIPSATNFVALDCGRAPAYAGALLAALADMRIFIRKPAAAGLDHCIRISVGSDVELEALARALPVALSKIRD